jgi:chromosome segregation ATPase
MFGFLSPTRRLRAAFAKQLDQMAQKLNEAVRERDAARMTAKTQAEKLAAKRDEIVNVFNERAAAESKLANADSENARLHRELNAARVHCEELAAKADTKYAAAKQAEAGVQAAERVRDRAIEDMNHIQELQKQAERDRNDALGLVGKLRDIIEWLVREVIHQQSCVREVTERVLKDTRERLLVLEQEYPPSPPATGVRRAG